VKLKTVVVQAIAFCLGCASCLVVSAATLYSIDKDAPTLREVDPLTGATIVGSPVTITGINSISGGRGLATDPATQTLSALLNISGFGTTRTLVTIDPDTGVAASIGNVSTGSTDAFESITFAEDGTLYGVSEQPNAERLYTIDKSDASVSIIGVLSTNFLSPDDEAVAFNPHDQLIYRGSGIGGGAVYQSVAPDPLSITGITTSGDSFSGSRALVFESAGVSDQNFLMAVVTAGNDDFFSITNGGVATSLGSMDHKSKGLAFVVPEPSTAAILIAIICLGAFTGSRRRRTVRFTR